MRRNKYGEPDWFIMLTLALVSFLVGSGFGVKAAQWWPWMFPY